MRVVMLAGAGSVGKTELLRATRTCMDTFGIRSAQHMSTTRQTYERAGLRREDDAFSDPAFNINFQQTVMEDNCNALLENVKHALDDDKHFVLADRSPYDYTSYCFQAFAHQLTLEQIENKRNYADSVISKILKLDPLITVEFMHLPFPAPWSEDTDSSDGWRADKTGKNYMWSAACANELAQAKHRYGQCDRLQVTQMSSFIESGSPEARALFLVNRLSQFRHGAFG